MPLKAAAEDNDVPADDGPADDGPADDVPADDDAVPADDAVAGFLCTLSGSCVASVRLLAWTDGCYA